MEEVIGINEQKLKQINQEILDYHKEIKNIFNTYTNIIEKTNIYFKGENAEIFRKKYKTFSNNFIAINKSFLIYSNDLLTLIEKYSHLDNTTIMLEK